MSTTIVSSPQMVMIELSAYCDCELSPYDVDDDCELSPCDDDYDCELSPYDHIMMMTMIVSSGGRGDEQPACKQHQEAGAGDADDDADGDADDYVDGDDNDDVDGDAYYLI